eukprot:CAMPEP_0202977644 /NCGR_PEP_ID=MMETSP1396-20130829/84373_1 /ASSEMBLY_ACC=CAM_ASM_000872 /TAXON_ID= /ORGANISM="Pseudokeronopsis sp., Strain Brazil" /LENGTH=114 /DNA_ID=CAMNT_0049716431 /DNA_START=181 /DNA_END=525 /DNA_ORIENTATION=+
MNAHHPLQVMPMLVLVFAADEFEEGALSELLVSGEAVEHVCEFRLVRMHVLLPKRSDGVFFGVADAADGRVREDHSGDVLVAHLQSGRVRNAVSKVEQALGQQTTSANGNGSQH